MNVYIPIRKHTNLTFLSILGYIQYVEFIAATLEARGSIEEYALREAFDHLDSDKSGFITKEVCKSIILYISFVIVDFTYILLVVGFKTNSRERLF